MRDGLKGTWALAAGSRGSRETSAPNEVAGEPVRVSEHEGEGVWVTEGSGLRRQEQ